MNHFRTQSLWHTQSLWNAVGDESSVTSFSTPKPRKTIMKKLTHIAAPVALTALLSACATAPGPVGELRDQVEKVTTALADQTVEGLRDDFEEVRMQFDEVKKKAEQLPEHQGLMAGLEDDFVTIGKQLDEVEKQADSTAKLDLANDLKGRLEALASRLDELKVKDTPEVAESVYRKLTYTFDNMDAVDLTKESREVYVKALSDMFDGHVFMDTMGREVRVEYGLRTEKYDPDKQVIRKGGKGEVAKVVFTLENLGNGITSDQRDAIENSIKDETDKAEILRDIKGIPVVKDDPPAKPVTFKTGEVTYISASGRGRIEESERHCPPIKARSRVEGIVKQHNADAFVVVQGEMGKFGKAKPLRDEVTFTFTAKPEWVKAQRVQGKWVPGECNYQEDSKQAHIMVLLSQDELTVAEYHTLVAKREGGNGGGPRVTHYPEPGLLTEGKPACPPPHPIGSQWKEEVREEFMKVMMGDCTTKAADE